jgi:hypothetical protein
LQRASNTTLMVDTEREPDQLPGAAGADS